MGRGWPSTAPLHRLLEKLDYVPGKLLGTVVVRIDCSWLVLFGTLTVSIYLSIYLVATRALVNNACTKSSIHHSNHRGGFCFRRVHVQSFWLTGAAERRTASATILRTAKALRLLIMGGELQTPAGVYHEAGRGGGAFPSQQRT